jgi:hypothetical protein
MEESGRASQEIAGLTEANSGETAPALTDSRFKLVLNDLTARILFERALSRRRNKILDPFFLEGSRQLERFLARILF